MTQDIRPSPPDRTAATEAGRLMGRRYHDANPDVIGSPMMSAEGEAWRKTWQGVPAIYFTDGYLAGFAEALEETQRARGDIHAPTDWRAVA